MEEGNRKNKTCDNVIFQFALNLKFASKIPVIYRFKLWTILPMNYEIICSPDFDQFLTRGSCTRFYNKIIFNKIIFNLDKTYFIFCFGRSITDNHNSSDDSAQENLFEDMKLNVHEYNCKIRNRFHLFLSK